jgi:hypothetical protein
MANKRRTTLSYLLEDPGFESRQGNCLISKSPGQLWGPPSLLLSGFRRSFHGVKQQRSDTDHSSPSIAKVNSEWSFTSAPPRCLQGVDKDSFPFSFILNCITVYAKFIQSLFKLLCTLFFRYFEHVGIVLLLPVVIIVFALNYLQLSYRFLSSASLYVASFVLSCTVTCLYFSGLLLKQELKAKCASNSAGFADIFVPAVTIIHTHTLTAILSGCRLLAHLQT